MICVVLGNITETFATSQKIILHEITYNRSLRDCAKLQQIPKKQLQLQQIQRPCSQPSLQAMGLFPTSIGSITPIAHLSFEDLQSLCQGRRAATPIFRPCGAILQAATIFGTASLNCNCSPNGRQFPGTERPVLLP